MVMMERKVVLKRVTVSIGLVAVLSLGAALIMHMTQMNSTVAYVFFIAGVSLAFTTVCLLIGTHFEREGKRERR